MTREGIETRLSRWRPAAAPPELMQRLHGAVPLARPAGRAWPLAYAALLAAWGLILALRLMTPAEALSPVPAHTARIDPEPFGAAGFTGAPATEGALLLARAYPEQLRP